MAKYDELFDAYAKSKEAQVSRSRELLGITGAVFARLGEILECPVGKYFCVDPDDPKAQCALHWPPIKQDENDGNYRAGARLILERDGQRGKMHFDFGVLIDFDSVWNGGEFIFSVPRNSKPFKIKPGETAAKQIDAFCQHIYTGLLAHLEGREDWSSDGKLGFHQILRDSETAAAGPPST
ncbi:MAG TPA: hypothetical protein VGM05_24980 [Planctomycetaceae bacterium]|jgi:hypothetical protein